MKNVLVIDTETTGFDPAKDSCIEIAAILYSLEYGIPLASVATVLPTDSNPAEHINHIPAAATDSNSFIYTALDTIALMSQSADVVMAHSKEFDRPFVEVVFRDGTSPASLPWVCSCYEIDWPSTPAKSKGIKLAHLAIAEGIPVIPNQLHRALADCQVLVHIMQGVPDMAERIRDAMAPKATLVAHVEYANRQLASDAGFSWNAKSKQWSHVVAAHKVEAFCSTLSFAASVIAIEQPNFTN